MSNLSLARIMYGTNEDLHPSHSMRWSNLGSPAAGVSRVSLDREPTGSGSVSFGGLLHKAWTSLTNRK